MKIKVITPETDQGIRHNAISIFLAGTIENVKAFDWQSEIIADLCKTNFKDDMEIDILNPRVKNWNENLEHDPLPGSPFNDQVTWELNHIISANRVVFNFERDSISPITLLELGLVMSLGKSSYINCPRDYFRYGNIKITADHFGYYIYSTYEDMLFSLLTSL